MIQPRSAQKRSRGKLDHVLCRVIGLTVSMTTEREKRREITRLEPFGEMRSVLGHCFRFSIADIVVGFPDVTEIVEHRREMLIKWNRDEP